MLEKWKSLLKFGSALSLTVLMAGQVSAQCESWEAYPNGVESAKEKHVVYRDLFKSKKYAEAFPIWEELFATVKIPLPAKSTHFSNGITMYKTFAKDEKDKTKKEEFLKKMMDLYEEKAGCLGETAKDRAWEGYYIYSARGSSETAIEMFEKSIELGKNDAPNMIFVPMTQLTIYLFQKKHPKFTADYMRALHIQLKGIAEHNIKNNAKEGEKYKAKWEKVEAEFAKIGGAIWGCDFFVDQNKPKFDADKTNMEQNAEILKIIKKKCGTDNVFYIEVLAIYQPYADSVEYERLKTEFEGLCNLNKGKFREMESRKFKKAGDEDASNKYKAEAFEWYEKSLADPITTECETTNEDKGQLAYRIAYRYFGKGSYSKARSLCYKAAEFKSGWGEPYMLIGNMYASSGKRCSGGTGTGWDAQVVAWAAMDMWTKAKSVDSSVASKANSSIAKYKKYLPTKGNIFQRGLKEGGSYKVGCWIGATTTIRSSGE
jgi:tetratricopeptide (TPR) repeat protein